MASVANETATPQFAHALRGYDRVQVDGYIEHLQEWAAGSQARAEYADLQVAAKEKLVADLRARIQELESARPSPKEDVMQEAVDRSAAAVAVAVQQAGEIRRGASQEAERLVTGAQQQALQIVEAARQSIAGVSEAMAAEQLDAQAQIRALTEEATRASNEARRQAEEEAAGLLAEARAEASRLTDEAKEQAWAMRERTEQEREVAEAALAQLHADREQILEELGRLRGVIHGLLAPPAGQDAADPDSGGARQAKAQANDADR
jgi:cell division septum initiation protein DivIVA